MSVTPDSRQPAAKPGSWLAARRALLARSSADAAVSRLGPAASRVDVPETPGMPPVLHLADTVRVDRAGRTTDGRHVVLITDEYSRTLATLSLTPNAAASLVSGLMPAAATAPRVIDALVRDLAGQG